MGLAIETNDDDRMRISQRMTIKELKKELNKRNVTFLSKAKKATLIDLLLLSSSAAASLSVTSTKKSSELVIDDEKDMIVAAAKKTITTKMMNKKREGLCNTDRQQGSKRIKSSTNHQAKVLTPRHAMMHTRCAGLSKTFFDSITQRARNRNETLQINNKRKSTNK